MDLRALATPALILDIARVRRNTARMAEKMHAHGVSLRPHLKTAKSAEVAKLATAGHAGGITVSTLSEARYFAGRGFRDITYAVGIVPAKVPAAAALRRDGATMHLLADDPAQVAALDAAASAEGVDFPVFVEIDSGQHRGGVKPGDPGLLEVAKAIHSAPSLSIAGVLTHGGHSYHAADAAQLRAIADDERMAVVAAAEALREAGLPCPAVSAGSTPTAVAGANFEGLTEMRPGVYTFFDLDQYGLGVCGLDDLALSVLATVVSHSDKATTLLVDAGALALSKDQLASEFLDDVGFGWVCDPVSLTRIGALRVASVDQEHGYVTAGGAAPPYDALPVGSVVRILPNHACMTAAPYDRYYVVDGDSDRPTEIVAEWDKARGWF